MFLRMYDIHILPSIYIISLLLLHTEYLLPFSGPTLSTPAFYILVSQFALISHFDQAAIGKHIQIKNFTHDSLTFIESLTIL